MIPGLRTSYTFLLILKKDTQFWRSNLELCRAVAKLDLNNTYSLRSGALLSRAEGVATGGFHEERTQQLRRRRHGPANLRRRWL